MIDVKALVGALASAVREQPELRRELVEALGVSAGAEPDRYLSVKRYAELHSIGESTTRAAIRDGRLEATKIGGSVRVKTSAVIGPKQADSPTARAERAWSKVAGSR